MKYPVLAGINEPKKGCHGVRKTRTVAAAYADYTEAQHRPLAPMASDGGIDNFAAAAASAPPLVWLDGGKCVIAARVW